MFLFKWYKESHIPKHLFPHLFFPQKKIKKMTTAFARGRTLGDINCFESIINNIIESHCVKRCVSNFQWFVYGWYRDFANCLRTRSSVIQVSVKIQVNVIALMSTCW